MIRVVRLVASLAISQTAVWRVAWGRNRSVAYFAFVNVGWGKNEKILMSLLLLFLFSSRHLFGCTGAVNWESSAAKNDYDLFSFILMSRYFEVRGRGVRESINKRICTNGFQLFLIWSKFQICLHITRVKV